MTTLARFTRGSNKIDLDEVTYYLGDDFKPPNPEREFNMASGTSLNRSGGASLVGTRALNRDVDFTVNVKGTTEAACIASARRLASFVMAGGDLFFELQLYPGLPEPLWGQFGSWLKYEVVTAIAKVNERYGNFGASASVHAQVVISLQVKPYALGNKQRLINAAGYVFENNYGSATGEALGLSIHEATTNKMTNPVLGHATFGNDWTAGSSIIATKNTDTGFCLPGLLQSAKVISQATTNNTYTQSIAAGNTNKHSFSAYVYLPDGGAPTTADFDIYYGSAQSTTYQSLGNGLYLAYSDNIDGISAATATGIVVKSGRTVYLCGFQMEEKAYHTPLAYGDLLGCAWTGTVHDSTSTRTATNINVTRTDDFIRLEEGAVSLVWKPYNANTFGANSVLFGLYKANFGDIGLLAVFNAADDKFYFTDGTNTISTAAQTFAAGATLYLTFTWGAGGLNIYKSGVNAATGATYTPASTTNQAVFVIGQVATMLPANGDFLGFDVYPTEITAAQALALYTAQAALVTGGKRVSSIPWLWTKDGDGIVDNCLDASGSTGAPHSNYSVAGGIPGDDDAETVFACTLSAAFSTVKEVIISNLDLDDFYAPENFLMLDQDTSADASASGGGYETGLTVTASDALLYSMITQNRRMIGRKMFAIIRAQDTINDTLYLGLGLKSTSTDSRRSARTSTSTGFRFYMTLPIQFPDRNEKTSISDDVSVYADSYYIFGRRATGTQPITMDYTYIVPADNIAKISSAIGSQYFIYSGGYADLVGSSFTSPYLANPATVLGSIIECKPNKYNVLISFIGTDGTVDPAISYTMTYNQAYITPRWSLL